MSRSIFSIIALIVIFIASCTPHREIVYFQDKQEVGDTVAYDTTSYKVKPGDILHVRVLTMEEENYKIFNTEGLHETGSSGGFRNEISIYINGYSVDEQGNIEMPVIGEVNVSGKAISEIRKHIQQKVDEYLIDATAVVKLVNFNVTVLGEVNRPGNYYIYDNQLTVADALGLAGDMTDFGNRKINVLRHTPEGAKFATLDLTDRQSFSSEYFYLQSNDIVYVEPTFAKRLGFRDFPFSVMFSAVTTTLLLLSYFN